MGGPIIYGDKQKVPLMDAAIGLMDDAMRQGKQATRQIVSEPCRYSPGSPSKIAVLYARYQLGMDLFLDDDCRDMRDGGG